MAPSHATTSCKNISSYTLTMSGLFNAWIRDCQKITYDSVDCLLQGDLFFCCCFCFFGTALTGKLFCLFFFFIGGGPEDPQNAHHMPPLLLFTVGRKLVPQLNSNIGNSFSSPSSDEALASISNGSCRVPEALSHKQTTCFFWIELGLPALKDKSWSPSSDLIQSHSASKLHGNKRERVFFRSWPRKQTPKSPVLVKWKKIKTFNVHFRLCFMSALTSCQFCC